ncbi:type II secretion system F family protein [Actinocatenispora rupis]|uniref:Type II secretion system protein GspF domain-containing protein n=1 Tax=Actinocatenispora rupis TaxID=519421 RepID=A0A8J3JCX5_9ACTN|nr:type II secretion system F family protein [Actinocatenispora rupis]GID13678.1 hypothetical protein Aru02nite_45670 [Actinocatenispora rupis]
MIAGLSSGALVVATVLLLLPYRTRRRLTAIPRTSASARIATARAYLLRLAMSARLAGLVGGAAGVLTGSLLAGPVAGLTAGAYCWFAVHAVLRHRAARTAAQVRADALDAVTALADDLRAGLAPAGALSRAWPRLVGTGGDGDQGTTALVPEDPGRVLRRADDPARSDITARLASVWDVALRTGAPLADLLDRLQADLVERERLRRKASAQTAAARMTAVLLALLPVAGIALGYGIGADPLRILWHTTIGALCTVVALALQLGGVAWTGRLTRPMDGAPA